MKKIKIDYVTMIKYDDFATKKDNISVGKAKLALRILTSSRLQGILCLKRKKKVTHLPL